MKKTIATLLAAGAVGSAAVLAVAYVGLVDVGADDPHFPAVRAFLTMARERSIAVRARDIEVPGLDDEALIRAGAGNYNAMCIGCHLAPGVAQTELSQALYPAPPNLAEVAVERSPAATFWVIKHGIKATGMPAWGKSMGDEYIWGMVAFLNRLPGMDAAQYKALVASSDGHQHGGGESRMHNHEGQHGDNRPGQHGRQHGQPGHHDRAAGEADRHAPGAVEATAGHPDSAPAGQHGGAAQHAGDLGSTAAPDSEPAPKAAPRPHLHGDGQAHSHEG